MKKSFDPKKYDMVFCPLCNGDGELPEDPVGPKICANCGGFGMIKDGKEATYVQMSPKRKDIK